MFIGRERELASLKEFYEKDGIGMISYIWAQAYREVYAYYRICQR